VTGPGRAMVILLVAAWPVCVAHANVKTQATDPAVEARMIAQGARLIADYGGYRLYDSPASPAGTEPRQDYNHVFLNAAPLETSLPALQSSRRLVGHFAGRRLHLIHFAGPPKLEWRRELQALGLRIVNYIPQNAYLVYGDAPAIARAQNMAASAPHVQWDGPYLDDYKIQPDARRFTGGRFSIQLAADAEANSATLKLVKHLAIGGEMRQRPVLEFVDVIARLAPADLNMIAAQPDVISIHAWSPPVRLDERQDQIIASNFLVNSPVYGAGYLNWLASKGFSQAQFDASGFVVDIADSGIDNGTAAPKHFGLYAGGTFANESRVVYNRLVGSPNQPTSLAGCDGHGTINAHIVGGFDAYSGFPFADSSGFHYGLGVCPFAFVGSSVIFDPDNWTSPDLTVLMSEAYRDGARISNNSWGDYYPRGGYDADSQELDALVRDSQPPWASNAAPGNQEMVIVFAAGNTGGGSAVDQPGGTAKNTICVGASDNVQPFSDGCGDDGDAVNANQIASFSVHGPLNDLRQKPDLVAPGSHITGGAPEAASPGSFGTADPCFLADHSGVTGVCNGNSPFFPASQQYYIVSDGTSHSAPAVAGACALLRQYFINLDLTPPSPAMTKAFLMNSARYLTGSTANDTLWSPKQGMGELNLGSAFDGVPRILRDELPDDLFTASGQARVFNGFVSDPTRPFLVTLAWSDAPGSTTAAAYNNDLDLTVAVGGQLYKGNVFSGRWSTNGGSADLRNNVESVFLPPGSSGAFTVTVTAASINSVGVPNLQNAPEQDFALVVYNAAGGGPPTIVPAGTTLVAESCIPGDAAIESGETVTVGFGLRNSGLVNTTNLVASLLPGGGVNSPGGALAYGTLAAGGPAVSQRFAFTASGACGSNVTATFQLHDGAANLGTANFTLPLCQPLAVFTESFDAAAAPQLPNGWVSDAWGGQAPWITQSTTFYTAPNAAFAAASTNTGVSELFSPPVAIHSAAAQLSFRHQFNLELNRSNAAVAFDGGVLEISVGAGAFGDILAAGATFATNGYNTTLADSSVTNNPLPGRRAWSGLSGGFITSLVNLPPAAAGQTVQFKWRCATDSGNANSSAGWWIDNVALYDGFKSVCCGCPAQPLILNPALAGTNFTFSFQTVANHSYVVQSAPALTNPTWASQPPILGDGAIKTVTNALTPNQRYYRIAAQ